MGGVGFIEPRQMSAFRELCEGQPRNFFQDPRTLVITDPLTAREALAFRPAIFRTRALMGEETEELRRERAIFREFTDSLTARSHLYHDSAISGLNKYHAIKALVIASFETYGPAIFGQRYRELKPRGIPFLLSRINDHYLRNTRGHRERVTRAFELKIAEYIKGPLAEDSFAYKITREDPPKSQERIQRLLRDILMGCCVPPAVAGAWVIFECRQGGMLDNFSSLKDVPLRHLALELLRMRPPAWNQSRIVTTPGIISGFKLSPGMEVLIPVGYIQTSSRDWNDPLSFHPTRWNTDSFKTPAYMPFSVGRRACIAAQLGISQLEELISIFGNQKKIYRLPASRYRLGPLYGPPNIIARPSNNP